MIAVQTKAQQIASSVTYKSRYKNVPGKAQSVILDALGIEADSSGHADAIFDALGISVSAQREGRKSVPVVRFLGDSTHARVAAANLYGDYGDELPSLTSSGVDFTPVQEWFAEVR